MLLSLIDIFLTNNATKVVKGIKALLQSMEKNIFFRSESVFTLSHHSIFNKFSMNY